MFKAELKSRQDEDICVSVTLDNHSKNYICECGDASGLTVKDCQDAEAIFISHAHIDHFVNFDSLIRHQIGTEKRIVVCGPQDITERVTHKLLAYTWNLIEAGSVEYEIREISESGIKRTLLAPPNWEPITLPDLDLPLGQIFSNERFAVHFTILDHKTPSVAYLFQEFDSVNINLKNGKFRGGPWIRELKEAFVNDQKNREITIGEKAFEAQELFYLLEIKRGYKLGIKMDHAPNEENHSKIKALFSSSDKVLIESFYN
ncbi:ribonuclease Z (plasmid) [Fulvitalea axinellae]|uniref:Ribonuclease Z n=1 Tax=Fulvitalea axinellae TaxID=1182444 RepID=A0AAU9CWK3_9BACT|nr:ribonuclease Z [Fulvitalea axinellae]